MQRLRLGGGAVEHAAGDAGDQERAAEHEACQLVRLRALNQVQEDAALVHHVGDALLLAQRPRRGQIAERALGRGLLVQRCAETLDLDLAEDLRHEAHAVFRQVLLGGVEVPRQRRQAERVRRVEDGRCDIAGLAMFSGLRAQGHGLGLKRSKWLTAQHGTGQTHVQCSMIAPPS